MRHELQDRTSIQMARRVAEELSRRPEETVAFAPENLDRWSQRNRHSPSLLRGYAEWRALLDLPVGEVIAILTAETDEGQRLRQNSPFPGIIPYEEVWEIKRREREAQDAV